VNSPNYEVCFIRRILKWKFLNLKHV
jgi:hypothetical protein